jgi:hypothetical protein
MSGIQSISRTLAHGGLMIVASLAILAQLQAPLVPVAGPRYDAPVAVTRAWPAPDRLTIDVVVPLPLDTPVVQRPRAVEYSDDYYTRLTIHRLGSYAMLPLFAAEYSLGENLIKDAAPAGWIKPTHVAVASGIGVLFAVNTATGLWNLWDARQDPDGRVRRTVHSLLMLASDVGFMAAAASAPEREDDGFTDFASYQHRVDVHRRVAIGSFALSTVGGAMMWFWK